MLTAFSVKNFKSIRDSGKIDIRPLTIFIGPNNSGKSSLLQFLFALKQTMESRDTESPFSTKKWKGYVDIGGYEDFIFLHEKENPLSFKLYLELSFERNSVSYQGIPTEFSLEENQKKKSKVKMNVVTESVIRYKQGEICLDAFMVDIDGKTIGFNSRGEFEQNFMDEKLLSRALERYWKVTEPRPLFKKEKFYYVPNIPLGFFSFTVSRQYAEGIIRESNKRSISDIFERLSIFEILNDFQGEIINSFTNLFYLGPLREYPRRYYFVSGEKPIHVGVKGERAVEVLLVTSRTSDKIFKRVNSWFEKLGVGKVSFKPLTESLYTLSVTHPTIKKGSQNVETNIAAGGFGASQILPVIVEGFYAPENAVILIEQPEIHLHPKLQAEMGDLLIDISKTEKWLVIETHSEHLLMRIQRRIAEGSITTDDVAIYYFEQEKGGTNITQLELDTYGRFTNWPKGFFEEDLIEAYKHAKVIAEKVEPEGSA